MFGYNSQYLLLVIGRRSDSPLGEVPAGSVNYSGGFPKKYPELLRADIRLLSGLLYPRANPSDSIDGES